MRLIRYAVIQNGYCVYGVGYSADDAVADAVKWIGGVKTEDEVWGLLKERPHDGELQLMDYSNPEFNGYMRNQGGFKLVDGDWVADETGGLE